MTNSEFKKWRDRLGYTQEQAADTLGISRPTIARYELHLGSIPKSIKLSCDYIELANKVVDAYLPISKENYKGAQKFPDAFIRSSLLGQVLDNQKFNNDEIIINAFGASISFSSQDSV